MKLLTEKVTLQVEILYRQMRHLQRVISSLVPDIKKSVKQAVESSGIKSVVVYISLELISNQ